MQILLSTIQTIAGVDKISLLITVITFMALLFGWVINRLSLLRIRHNSERSKDLSTIMQRTLSSSNNYLVGLLERIGECTVVKFDKLIIVYDQ